MLAADNITDGLTTRHHAVNGGRNRMKRLLATVTLLAGVAWGSAAHAQYPSTSSRNIFGRYNFSSGGNPALRQASPSRGGQCIPCTVA
jgi:hypothetical protein